tara:strand:+ start:345 stop:785 length:441 start_codon:yes stop_codon:yes gene_type:complete
MNCNLTNYFLLSSLLLGLLDLGFFLYGSIFLTGQAHLRFNIHCVSYFDYCIFNNLVFLGSIVVLGSFIFCNKRLKWVPILLLCLNVVANIAIGVYNFVEKDVLCNSECVQHCETLVNYGNNFTIFMITNLSCLGVILFGSLFFTCK